MNNIGKDFSHIKGWGIDADPKNDPTYPMKRRTDAEQQGYSWQRPTQQPVNVEVLHSNERPNVTSVFGTSTPPSGLSGMIRRFAFKYSESSYGHWLPLLVADRVNVVEGVLEDLTKGRIPNIFAEKGWNAEWKHNPKGLVQKVAIGVLVTTAVVVLLSRKKDHKHKHGSYSEGSRYSEDETYAEDQRYTANKSYSKDNLFPESRPIK